MPFGAGERICIGMNFSMAEQRVFHTMLIRKYEYSLRPNSEHANGMVNAKAMLGLFGPQELELSLKKRY